MNTLAFKTASQMSNLANHHIEMERDAEIYVKETLNNIFEDAFNGKPSRKEYMTDTFRSSYGDQVINFLKELDYEVKFIDNNNFWIFWNV